MHRGSGHDAALRRADGRPDDTVRCPVSIPQIVGYGTALPRAVRRCYGTQPIVPHARSSQRAIYDEIAASRPTGVHGPFGPWLASPGIAQPAQQLGRVCRLETSLPRAESELAILITAARHNATTEWAIHSSEARKAGVQAPPSSGPVPSRSALTGVLVPVTGVPDAVIAAIQQGERPRGLAPRAAAVHDFARSVLTCSNVDDVTYEEARLALGEVALVELTSIVGYYSLVAFTLNVFRIPP